MHKKKLIFMNSIVEVSNNIAVVVLPPSPSLWAAVALCFQLFCLSLGEYVHFCVHAYGRTSRGIPNSLPSTSS